MLAQRHVRAVLLGAAGRDDDRRGAGLERGPDLGPGQRLELDTGRCRLGRRAAADSDEKNDEGRPTHVSFYANTIQAASAVRGSWRR